MIHDGVNLNSSLPVRLDSATRARLQAISDRTGMSLGQLVRLAIDRHLDHIEDLKAVPMKQDTLPYRIRPKK